MSANPHQDQPPRARLDGEVVGLLLLVVAFLLGLILLLPLTGHQVGSLIGARRALLDWAGWLAWLLPVPALAYGVATFTNASLRELTRWVLGGLLAVFAVLCLQAFFLPGQPGHPSTAGLLAEGLVRELRPLLGLAAPLLLLFAALTGLSLMLGVSPLGLTRRLVHRLIGLLTGVGHNVQGAIEARMPGSGTVVAHNRTDVRGQLSELRGHLDALRRIDPTNIGLKEPSEKVRRLQRDIRNYDEEQLKQVREELTTYDLMTRNALLQTAHDLRAKVEQEAVPEGEQATSFLRAVVDDRRHELSVFLPATQASAALEHLRRHLVNQILSIGGKAKKLESERCAAERHLKRPTVEMVQREHDAHERRLRQWQEVQERFQKWHAYERAYAGWPDLAAAFDSGPTEAATRVANELQKRTLETLQDQDKWREFLRQATEQERQRQLAPPEDDLDEISWPEAESSEPPSGLFSRLGHTLSRLMAPPGPDETPAAESARQQTGAWSGEQPLAVPDPRSAVPGLWDDAGVLAPAPPVTPIRPASAHAAPANPVYGAPAVPTLDIDFSAPPRRSRTPAGPRPDPAPDSRRPVSPLAPTPQQPLFQPSTPQPRDAAEMPAPHPARVPPGRPAAAGNVTPPASPHPARPPSPTLADFDLWDDEEDMPFGPPAPPPRAAVRPTPRLAPVSPASAPVSHAAPWDEPAAGRPAPAPSQATPSRATPSRATPSGVSRRGAVRLALPSEQLLDPLPNAARNTVQMDLDAERRGDMINETLRQFGLQAKVVDLARGPTVTRYEIEPAPGEKISRIASLSNDLARALAVGGVRVEAPVPGKSVIGLEVPNAEREPVTFHQATAHPAFKNTRAKLPIILGKSIDGSMMVGDLAKMPHLLVAGSTGSGKSVCVNTLITSLLYRYLPTELRFVMIDPKMVELTPYDGIPHLVRPVVTNPADAAGVLLGAVAHMERRYKMMSQVGAKNLEQFNAKMRAVGEVELPHLVIIIDELADLMITSPKEVESAIMRLAQMARATGMHLILATQRPSVDILTSLIKVNIPARIAFAVSSSHDSRTILDTTGAERLTGMGDMLFYQPGLVKPLRLQGPYISEAESARITEELRRMMFDDDFIEAYGADFEGMISSSGPGGDRSQLDFSDPLLRQAALVCIEEGQGSVSRLQRRLSVGHARAGKLMDLLEAMNIVGPHQGSKPREVLIHEADLPEYFGK